MSQDELNKVEIPAIAQLKQLGWEYSHGDTLTPTLCKQAGAERSSYRDVELVKQLNAPLKRLNPWISAENLRKVSREITHPVHAGLMEYNQAFHQMLVNLTSVDQDLGKGRKGQSVRIIDFDTAGNNQFLCVSQFRVDGANQNIIPDIVCFVNGIPLAVIECKSPGVTNPISDGINQLRRYANLRRPFDDEGAQKLFWYNQLMI
ncbi:MAG: type I restriction endonuclease subunit R, partial [Algicola sp.]|nr:type I restriction endonuclease subunit R [Algicola sp.]